jgi:hypothetical protein
VALGSSTAVSGIHHHELMPLVWSVVIATIYLALNARLSPVLNDVCFH